MKPVVRGHFFASTLNRLVFIYGISLLLAFTVIGGLSLTAYDQLVYRDTRQTVLAEHQGLRDVYQSQGNAGLAKAIEQRVVEDTNREAVYLLIQRDGTVSAGHLSDMPTELLRQRGWTHFSWNDDGDEVIAYVEKLSDGALLVTGHTTGEQQHQREVIVRLGVAILSLLAALTLLLGWLLRRALDRALQHTLDTVDRFAAGRLEERIPIAGGDDALTRLAITMNRMLDRIRDLIGGIQSSSDAIAHDLRTPLMRLKTRLEQARLASESDNATHTSATRTIDEAIDEADQLLLTFNSLLRLARLESNETLPTEAVALDEILTDAIDMWQAVAEAQGRMIVTSIEPARIAGDGDLLFQMLSNLLDNAVKYSAEDGRITVDLRQADHQVQLSISNDGAGIPVEDHERVFDRFVRLERHRGSAGTGLGLSVVRAIATRHHAEIRLSDAHPGIRIELRFPRFDRVDVKDSDTR